MGQLRCFDWRRDSKEAPGSDCEQRCRKQIPEPSPSCPNDEQDRPSLSQYEIYLFRATFALELKNAGSSRRAPPSTRRPEQGKTTSPPRRTSSTSLSMAGESRPSHRSVNRALPMCSIGSLESQSGRSSNARFRSRTFRESGSQQRSRFQPSRPLRATGRVDRRLDRFHTRAAPGGH